MKSLYTFKAEKLRVLINWPVRRLHTGGLLLFSILVIIIFFTGCGSEFEILLHEKGVIYWTETSGAVKRIYTDLSGKKTIMTLSSTPLDIEIFDNKIYLSEYSGSGYNIKRFRPDGSGEITLYNTSSPVSGPFSLAIDRSDQLIFWNEYHTHNDIWNSVMSSNVMAPVKWINTITYPYTYAICIDSINRKIYFTANTYYDNGIALGNGNTGGIYLYELDSMNTYNFDISDSGPGVNMVPFKDIAVDVEKDFVFYVLNTNVVSLCIRRRDLALQNPVVWVPANGFDIDKIALDMKDRKIYWTSKSDNSIYRADLDYADSNVEKFIQLDSIPTGIAISQ